MNMAPLEIKKIKNNCERSHEYESQMLGVVTTRCPYKPKMCIRVWEAKVLPAIIDIQVQTWVLTVVPFQVGH